MSRWFRHYAGMMRDDKLVSAAIRAKQPVERVVWVWGAILESAAEIDDGGRFNLDAAEVAYFLRADDADIRVVMDALVAMGRISDDRVVKWGERQFTSDRSADRQAKYRERKRVASNGSDEDKPSGDGGVTSPSRHGDAPEAEAETDTETEAATQLTREAPPANKYDLLLSDLLEANGVSNFREERSPGLVNLSPIIALIDAGLDRDRDVIAGIRASPKPKARTWNYLVPQIEEFARARRGASALVASMPKPAEADWQSRMEVWRKDGTWAFAWGAKPGERGCKVPTHLIHESEESAA